MSNINNNTLEFKVFILEENVLYSYNTYEEMVEAFEEELIWNLEEEIYEIARLDEDYLNENELPENSLTIEEL